MVPDNQLYLAAFTGGLACTAPLIHFILIKQGLNIFIATSLILSTILSFPAIFGNLHLGYVTILGLSLRLIDTALHGTVVLRELSLQEYLQYYLSFKMPSRIKTDPLQFHYLERNRVPYSKVATVSHLLKTSLSLIFKVTLLYGIIEIVRYKRSDWQPLTYGLSTISDLPYYYMLGLGISICLEGGYTVAMIASCLVFKLDFVPVMTHPFLATSIKDFWVNWNLIVQGSLRRIVFDPTMKYFFGHRLPLSADNKIPAWHSAVAGLMTFIFSGIMHEWMVWACFSESTKYEQLIFFTLHGVLAILEVTFKRLLRSSTGFDYNKRVPWILQLLGTQVLLAFISPFFLNQMVREQTYFRLGFAATQ